LHVSGDGSELGVCEALADGDGICGGRLRVVERPATKLLLGEWQEEIPALGAILTLHQPLSASDPGVGLTDLAAEEEAHAPPVRTTRGTLRVAGPDVQPMKALDVLAELEIAADQKGRCGQPS
jgi:hypothetical protein